MQPVSAAQLTTSVPLGTASHSGLAGCGSPSMSLVTCCWDGSMIPNCLCELLSNSAHPATSLVFLTCGCTFFSRS